ncbi:MAG: UPF0149 family protein [Methylotetracoccus sp.]
MPEFPSYRRLDDLADGHDNRSSAAEIHGTLVGMLCGDRRVTRDRWVQALFDGETGPPGADEQAALELLFRSTKAQLDASAFDFELFLPDDAATLAERARALGEWCHGFLFGLALVGGRRDWSGESLEVMQDFVEISRIESETASLDDKEAFEEVAEFVRVAVHVIRNEAETSPVQTLH